MSSIKENPAKPSLYQHLLDSGFSGLEKRNFSDVVDLVTQLFNSSLLLVVIQSKNIPKGLSEKILSQRIRHDEIQSGLNENMTVAEIAKKAQVSKWLTSQRTLVRVKDPMQQMDQEVLCSYATLAFPFQATRARHLQHPVQIAYWGEEFEKAEAILYRIIDEGIDDDCAEEDIYRLQRVLCFHDALFERGKKVSWLQVLADWSQTDFNRKGTVEGLLLKFSQLFPNTLTLPKPKESETQHAMDNSLQVYLLSRTGRGIKKIYGSTFEPLITEAITIEMKVISVRHDLAYFLHHKSVLIKLEHAQRASDPLVRNFRIFEIYLSAVKELETNQQAQLLLLIWLSDFEDDFSDLNKYLPQNLTNLTQESFFSAWKYIESFINEAFEKTNEKSQVIYLLGFFIEYPDYVNALDFTTGFKVLEIIKFFHPKEEALRRVGNALFYTSIQEAKDFEKDLACISHDFNDEQKHFLHALYSEEAFRKYFLFLAELASILESKFDHDFAFHFLMSDFKTEKPAKAGKPSIPVYDELKEALKVLKTALKEEKDNKQSIEQAAGKIMVCLSQASIDADQTNICFSLQELIWRKLDLIEEDASNLLD